MVPTTLQQPPAGPPAPPGVHRRSLEAAHPAIDRNGHVNNVTYVQWMQEVAVEHADLTGCTAATINAGATWFIRRHHVEYLRPALVGDPIAVYTWVVDYRRARSLRRYEFLRTSDGHRLAWGETEWVFVGAADGRPRTIPEPVRAAFTLVAHDWRPTAT